MGQGEGIDQGDDWRKGQYEERKRDLEDQEGLEFDQELGREEGRQGR